MGSETPRLSLQIFAPGDTDWDHTDTVEALDELAIERGTIEERPETGSYDDALYLATDQRILWRWDAEETDWQIAGGIGSDEQPVDEIHATSTATDELSGQDAEDIGVRDDLELEVDHDTGGRESSVISWDTPGHWEYNSGEFHSLLETSYANGGGYGVSGHWQIMSAHHYGPAYGLRGASDVLCPIHVYGTEPDHGAAEFSITFGDYHARRHRMWLSKAGGAMLEEPSPEAELSVLTNYHDQRQITHLALTPNYLREQRGDGTDEITSFDTPITPGTFRFRGAYWDDGLQTARLLQFTPSMDGDAHEFHVDIEVEDRNGEMIESARVDQTGGWRVGDLSLTNRLQPPAVENVEDLPPAEEAHEPELVWVREETQWFTFSESAGWIAACACGREDE